MRAWHPVPCPTLPPPATRAGRYSGLRGTRWRSPALLLGLLLCLPGCSQLESRGKQPATASVFDPPRTRYIKATVEVACLSRHTYAPEEVASRTYVIYRHYGFEPIGTYLELVETLGQDKTVQQEIEDGLKNCP